MKPNILFIFSDDQRHDTIHAFGNGNIRTPNIDSLVNKGTMFTNAHIMGSMSEAVCMPSRAMLMTGRTLFHLKGKGRTVPQEHVTLPETLRQNEYTTYHVGKWHQDGKAFLRSFSHGKHIFGFGARDWLQEWDKDNGAHWNIPLHDFDPMGEYSFENRYIVGKTDNRDKIHSSTLFTNAAIEFLRNHKKDKQFFMYLAYVAPHDPRQAPKKFRDMYSPDKIPLPKNYMSEHPFDNGEMKVRDEALEKWPRTPEAIQKHIADYYAIITHMDSEIGRILDVLKESGLEENTIIIFSSDNGLAVGQHGLLGKQNLYQHSVHVPLIFCGPGIPENEKRNTLCYLLDIFPSICSLTGVTIPKSVEGNSLVPAIHNPNIKIRNILRFAYKNVQRGVRDERYKLIEYNVNNKRTTQLFDLQTDPWEMNNLTDNPLYTDHLARLRKELVKWKDELGDTSPFWNNFE